jgi:hypothetical protein
MDFPYFTLSDDLGIEPAIFLTCSGIHSVHIIYHFFSISLKLSIPKIVDLTINSLSFKKV